MNHRPSAKTRLCREVSSADSSSGRTATRQSLQSPLLRFAKPAPPPTLLPQDTDKQAEIPAEHTGNPSTSVCVSVRPSFPFTLTRSCRPWQTLSFPTELFTALRPEKLVL